LAPTSRPLAGVGHASQQAALRYQHATAQRDRVIADALDGLIRAYENET